MNKQLKEMDVKIRNLQDEFNQAGTVMNEAKANFKRIGKMLMEAEEEEKKLKALQKNKK